MSQKDNSQFDKSILETFNFDDNAILKVRNILCFSDNFTHSNLTINLYIGI